MGLSDGLAVDEGLVVFLVLVMGIEDEGFFSFPVALVSLVFVAMYG